MCSYLALSALPRKASSELYWIKNIGQGGSASFTQVNIFEAETKSWFNWSIASMLQMPMIIILQIKTGLTKTLSILLPILSVSSNKGHKTKAGKEHPMFIAL